MARYYRYRDRGWESGLKAVWLLIAANVAVLIAVFIRPEAVSFLALQRDHLASQPWTIITSMFTHQRVYHIFGNMYMLWFMGTILESAVGLKKFLILYLVGGLIGNGLFLLLAPPYVGAIGASGAVMAVAGAIALVRPRIKVALFPIPIPMDLWVFVLITGALFGVALPFIQQGGFIAWQAHLGGLVTGVVAGLYFRWWERKRGIRFY